MVGSEEKLASQAAVSWNFQQDDGTRLKKCTRMYVKTKSKNRATKEEGELPVHEKEMEKRLRNGVQQSTTEERIKQRKSGRWNPSG